MLLITILLSLLANCNKIINLDNRNKFNLTIPQREKISKGDIETLKNFISYYGDKKFERSCEGEVPLLYVIKYFNSTHPSEKEETEKIILENITPYISAALYTEYDKKGNTPLHHCLEKDYFKIFKALLGKNRKVPN